MNNMWGSMAQYNEIYWPWPIAVYLFLAGLSAGAMMVALILRYKRINFVGVNQESKFDSCFKAGAILAPLAISVGLALLVFDLGKPLSFYWILLKYNFTSVMSIGVALLLVYTPLAFVFAVCAFSPQIFGLNFVPKFVKDLIKWLLSSKILKLIEISLFILAIGVGVYTGFLLSAISKIPLWHNGILPLLFLVSGFSSGVATSILCGMLFFKDDIDKHVISNLLKFDLFAIFGELILLCALFGILISNGGADAKAAKDALSFSGVLPMIFWVGVVGIGLLTPILIDFTALKNHAYKPKIIILNTIIVICGVLLLRYFIVYAGQIYTGV